MYMKGSDYSHVIREGLGLWLQIGLKYVRAKQRRASWISIHFCADRSNIRENMISF